MTRCYPGDTKGAGGGERQPWRQYKQGTRVPLTGCVCRVPGLVQVRQRWRWREVDGGGGNSWRHAPCGGVWNWSCRWWGGCEGLIVVWSWVNVLRNDPTCCLYKEGFIGSKNGYKKITLGCCLVVWEEWMAGYTGAVGVWGREWGKRPVSLRG